MEKRPMTYVFDRDYAATLAEILRQEPSTNERTGKKVKAIHGVHFRIEEGQFPLLHLRDINPLWSCAEAVWFISGGRSPEFMQGYGFKNWDAFKDNDGLISSATGFRWRQAFDGVDQLTEVMAKLSKDPTTRQAVMISWKPAWDLINPGPNAPCIIAWHLEILGGALHMSIMQRSADMYFGFPHDILGFRIVQSLMASALKVKSGIMSYHISNAHLYQDQWYSGLLMVSRACNDESRIDGRFRLCVSKHDWGLALQANTELPIALCNELKNWYKPWPAIKGPRLVA
jgi:thymidylate synthase